MQGTVRGADGTPVPGARVIVTLLRSNSERTSIGLGAAFSLGLSCVTEKRGCRAPTTTGVSAADGSYAVTVPTNNGDKPVGVALSVVAAAGVAGESIPESEIPRTGTTIAFPAKAVAGSTFDVPIGSAPLELEAGGNKLRATLPATRSAYPEGPVTVTVTQLPAEGDVSAATTDFSETPAKLPAKLPFDLRMIEDRRLLVTARQEAKIGKLPVTLSATRILIGTAVPASRDA